MKGQILQYLRDAEDVVSGETLRTALATSRVTVWKHIRNLQEIGYDIEATPRGYRLISSPDTPYPWEFPGRATQIHYAPEVDSTMEIARKLGRNGCPHMTVAVTDRQRKGRGRLRRAWHSEAGGLYFTVVVRPQLPPLLSFRVNFAASLTLVRLLRERYRVNARVKWPNDILVEDRKLVGMLSEMEADADLLSFVSIGLGINVNNTPSVHEPGAVSLRELTGRTVSRKALLAAFLDAFEDLLAQNTLETVVAEWKDYTMTLNRQVRVVTVREEFQGRAVDVDSEGALILELPDGTRQRVIYGDCFLQKRNPE